MSRPVTIDDAKLLRVARQLFLEKGMGASTTELAKKVGIAQGSIFRRYRTKEDLFRAAMLSEVPTFLLDLPAKVEEKGLRAALEDTAFAIISFQRKMVPAMLMTWSNRQALKPGKRSELHELSPLPPAAEEMIRVFAAQMKAGRLRKQDPLMVAFSFFSPCMAYVLVELMRGAHPIPVEKFVSGLVENLWNGIAPKGSR